MHINDTLRTLREYLNLSIQEVAEGAKLSFRTVLRAEKGNPLSPGSRQRLCKFYGKTSEELGLVPQHRREQEQNSNDVCTVQEILVAIQNLEHEDINMEHARHLLLQMLEDVGVALAVAPIVLQKCERCGKLCPYLFEKSTGVPIYELAEPVQTPSKNKIHALFKINATIP
jgi:transcriptional regulator with XRE-family HTH domain